MSYVAWGLQVGQVGQMRRIGCPAQFFSTDRLCPKAHWRLGGMDLMCVGSSLYPFGVSQSQDLPLLWAYFDMGRVTATNEAA